MFVQVITGKVKDTGLLQRQMARWQAEIKPSVKGYLGSTGGIATDGRSVWVARFESTEAARSNSANAQQDAWWNETAKAYEVEPTFHDCTEVDTMLDGGSNDAGFVQVIEGRAKDEAVAREFMRTAQDDLRAARPDLIGGLVAWHGDGGGFTQVAYFRSEKEARTNEAATEDNPRRAEFQSLFAGEPAFYDFTDPQLD